MEKKYSQTAKFFKLDYSKKGTIGLTEQDTLRKLVGILGMILPLILFLFLLVDTGYSNPLESISHYYLTRASGVLVITVGVLAIFLLVYKGEETIDFYFSSIAGICALCLLLFPTSNLSDACCDSNKTFSVTFLKESAFRVTFHYISASIFLTCLAYMSLFLFTKSDKPVSKRTKGKKMRNKIFRTCGVIMVLSILTILAGFLEYIPGKFYDDNHLTFWMETVAVESFGISWLVKGAFKD